MAYQQRRQQFPSRGGSTYHQAVTLPLNYLVKGYFDGEGNILPSVVVDWPRDIATKLASSRLKVTQLRRFFGECRRIQSQLNAGKDFAALRGRILKLDAYSADAVKKGNAPPLFKQFIEQNMKWATKDRRSFLDGFIQHFESVVAYFPER